MLTIFGAVAELEREYLLQRQKEGIQIAKEQGRYKGRPRCNPPEMEQMLKRWQAGDVSATKAMNVLGISKSTFYRMLRKNL